MQAYYPVIGVGNFINQHTIDQQQLIGTQKQIFNELIMHIEDNAYGDLGIGWDHFRQLTEYTQGTGASIPSCASNVMTMMQKFFEHDEEAGVHTKFIPTSDETNASHVITLKPSGKQFIYRNEDNSTFGVRTLTKQLRDGTDDSPSTVIIDGHQVVDANTLKTLQNKLCNMHYNMQTCVFLLPSVLICKLFKDVILNFIDMTNVTYLVGNLEQYYALYNISTDCRMDPKRLGATNTYTKTSTGVKVKYLQNTCYLKLPKAVTCLVTCGKYGVLAFVNRFVNWRLYQPSGHNTAVPFKDKAGSSDMFVAAFVYALMYLEEEQGDFKEKLQRCVLYAQRHSTKYVQSKT